MARPTNEDRIADPVVVELAVEGFPQPQANWAERREIIGMLVKRGVYNWLIAEQLGVSRRTVERHRQAMKVS